MKFDSESNKRGGTVSKQARDINNIYQLDSKVPLAKAIPFGLQHVLAMFVANIAPIIIVAGACGLDAKRTAVLIQTAMIVAGIGSMIQNVFAENCVAVVFLVSLILNLVLPKDMDTVKEN